MLIQPAAYNYNQWQMPRFSAVAASLILTAITAVGCAQNRVSQAEKNLGSNLQTLAKNAGLKHPIARLYLRAIKDEKVLEIWGSDSEKSRHVLVKKHQVLAQSGILGPKRKEGDRQVPEGLYYINRFNPRSNFHLSLGINYPNPSDLILGDRDKPGSDIFIHGRAVSIGCLAMGDPAIEEIYLLALNAKNAGQTRIRADFFPFRMTSARLKAEEKRNPKLSGFWRNLAPFWQMFEADKVPSRYSIDKAGRYVFTPQKSRS